MQYLITTYTDSSGNKYSHVTKARENQMFTVVEAKSKEQAMKIYERIKNTVALNFASIERKFKPGITSFVKPLKPKDSCIFNEEGD
ncbi:MAG: DUF1381 domain-containing protein [Staphylococcus warneri]|uniref:DUF1381 domain-containing protein n=1 Tax=Staphylococcus warneri TaxID=1292 RepID=UPI0009A55B59|nr:DUF1381 domain-containing protein [Staphylococcus warneri]MCM3482265.1 DUF1381 domain-containing protein [Staphylococcus warneri]MCT1632275.1 DUF1381 domain-containing protein [Staphylococcus warneri]MCT2348248.1 DUF1381 domain-containing protein [Staphylococcus warneri]MCV7476678.1 DUF1381 domain-containing protein [Staphylococcus warneri]MDK8516427.1 DUF1381 domain-containing protein [Staphylococcus warneri]